MTIDIFVSVNLSILNKAIVLNDNNKTSLKVNQTKS